MASSDSSIILLLAIAAVCVFIAIINTASKNKKAKEIAPAPPTDEPERRIKSTIGEKRGETTTSTSTETNSVSGASKHTGPTKTLDQIYADGHAMWSCPYCETLNDNREGKCLACGAPR